VPTEFDAVTLKLIRIPASAGVSVYVALVAPAMMPQSASSSSQRFHW
jgi:hypothetical protein